MSTGTRDAVDVLEKLIRLCDDLAWGRPADENALFALTRKGASTPQLERLAEAFGRHDDGQGGSPGIPARRTD